MLPFSSNTPTVVLLFVGCHVTIMVRLMYLVLAVVVDQAADARLEDEVQILADRR